MIQSCSEVSGPSPSVFLRLVSMAAIAVAFLFILVHLTKSLFSCCTYGDTPASSLPLAASL